MNIPKIDRYALCCIIFKNSILLLLLFIPDDENVFKRLHSHFTWMLKAGAHTYTETLYTSHDLLNKLQPNTVKGSIFDSNICKDSLEGECISIRMLENLLSMEVFRTLLYCTLCGISVS